MYAPVSEKFAQRKLQQLAVRKDSFASNDDDKLEWDLLSNEDLIPMQLVKAKVRAIGSLAKHHQKTMPRGLEQQALFGLTTVKPGCRDMLVITEGEYDAMAVHQATGVPAVSLPQGASHLPKQMLAFFEEFEKIVLWMDADEVGQRSAEKFAKVLGPQKTIIIDPRIQHDGKESMPKDANDVLRQGKSFEEFMQ